MNRTEFLEMDPYSISQADKESFYRGEVDGSLHIFKGRYSDDGNILFISEID